MRIFGPWMVGHPQFVRRFETRIAAHRPRRPSSRASAARLLAGAEPGRHGEPAGPRRASAASASRPTGWTRRRRWQCSRRWQSGIAVAHRLGVVHGRLRPENILFDDAGNPYVADLGIDEICTGIVSFATHAYDAPERLGGALATPASDIYSLGMLVHELLGGSPPPPDGAVAVGAATPSTPSWPGRPIPTRAAATARSTSSSTTCADALAVPLTPSSAFLPTRNPYRGLEPFEEADAARLPRSRHGDRARWSTCSGGNVCWSSSVHRASASRQWSRPGSCPRLRRGAIVGSESWLVTEMTPGSDPFEQLRTALARVAVAALAGRRRRAELVRTARSTSSFGASCREARTSSSSSTSSRSCSPRPSTRRHAGRSCGCSSTPPTQRRCRRADRRHGARRLLRSTARLRRVRGRHQGADDRPRRDVGGRDGRGDPPAGGRASASTSNRRSSIGSPPRPNSPRERCRSSSISMAELFAERHDQRDHARRLSTSRAGWPAPSGGAPRRSTSSSTNDTRSAAREVFLRLVSVDEEHEDTRRRVRRTELEHPGSPPTSSTSCCASTADTGCSRSTAIRPPGRRRWRSPTKRSSANGPASRAGSTRHARTCSPAGGSNRPHTTGSPPDPMPASCSPAAGSSWPKRGRRTPLRAHGTTSSGSLAPSRTRVDRDAAARARRRRRITQALVGIVVVTAAVAAYALVQRSAADREARETRARELAGQAQLAIAEDPERAIMLALARERDDRRAAAGVGVGAAGGDASDAARRDKVDGVGVRQSSTYAPDGSMVAVDSRVGASRCRASSIRRTATCWPTCEPHRIGIEGSGVRSRRRRAGRGLRATRATVRCDRAFRGAERPRRSAHVLGTGRLLRAALVPSRTDGGWGRCVRDGGLEREIVVWAVDVPGRPDLARARDRVRVPPRHRRRW